MNNNKITEHFFFYIYIMYEYICNLFYFTASDNLKTFFSTCKDGAIRLLKVSIIDGKSTIP